jgi:hypothetical protein
MSTADQDNPTAPRLHILLAMCYLVHRTGAELFTRDLALWLRRRGHSVTVFATTFGEMADELRYESIACITDPALLTRRPDVIIGSTHHETVRAIVQFPDVPAISICHDRSHEHGYPPRLRQVRRYVAVDDNCAERLLHEHGLAQDVVCVIPNGVDLQRFKPRAELPPQPRRALVFSNYAEDDALLAEIRGACSGAGLQLDAFGARLGNLMREPSELLADYDLVFAKGRAATEALAVGCACILLDHSFRAMGPLVSRAEVEHARRWNFGRALLTQPITTAALIAQIARYDAADAAAVRDWVRTQAGLDVTCAALEALALEVAGERSLLELTPEQQIGDLRAYVADWAHAHHPTGEHVLIAELREHVSQLQRELQEGRRAYAEEQIRTQTAGRDLGETLRQLESQAVAREQELLERLQRSERAAADAARESDARMQLLETQAAARVQNLRDELQRAEQTQHEAARERDERLKLLQESAAARERELAHDLRCAEQSRRDQDEKLRRLEMQTRARERELLDRLQQTQATAAATAVRDAGQLRESEQRALALHNRAQALLDSASWRVTAPLRRLYALITNVVRR